MSRGWLAAFAAEEARLLGDLEALVRLESPSHDAAALPRSLRSWRRAPGGWREAERRACPPAATRSSPRSGRGGRHAAARPPRHGLARRLVRRAPVAPRRRPGLGPRRLRHEGRDRGGDDRAARWSASRGRRPATLLLVPDEETGSAASRALTVELARRHRRVLVLEPSQDGAAKVARKACGTFRVRFRGRAAHAGLEPEKGASALAEMSRFVLFPRRRRRGRWHDAHPVPGPGGQRAERRARRGRADRGRPRLDRGGGGARRRGAARLRPGGRARAVAVEGGFDRPPLEPTDASGALRGGAPAAEELGFELGAARVGGASDGNFTAAAGVPTLDGLGPAGAGRTPGTSTCSSRTSRGGRRSSPPSSPTLSSATRPSRAAMRCSSGGCVESSAIIRDRPEIFNVASSGLRSSTTLPWASRRRSAATMLPRPASAAPPASARNSRWRENHAVIIEPSRPKTICAAMNTIWPAMKPSTPAGPRRRGGEDVARDRGHDVGEVQHERVHDALDEGHRHHVAVRDVGHLVAEDALDLLVVHRPRRPLDTATRLRFFDGPVAKAFSSGDS